MMGLDGLTKLIFNIYLGDNMKDFTQTTNSEAIELLNKEILSLRNTIDEMKERFISNREYIKYLTNELRKYS